MERLQGRLAELIDAETEAVQPPDDAKAKHWAAVSAAFGAPPPPAASAPASGGASAAAGSGLLKIVGITMIAGAVGVGAWALRSPDPSPTAPAAVAQPEPAPAPAPEPEPEPEPSEVARPDPGPTPIADPAPTEPPPPARATPKAAPAPAPAPVRGLAEELALVEKIRRAVQAGDHTEALKRSAEHRRDFPKGSLVPDRLDLEATARCRSGQLERGRDLARKRAERWPKAPVSDRMRQACALDEVKGA